MATVPIPESALRRLLDKPARTGVTLVDEKTKKQLAYGRYHLIARHAGLSPQHTSRVINGKVGCSIHVAARIALASGITIDQLYAYMITRPTLVVKGRRTLRELVPKRKIAKIERRVRESYLYTKVD
jgi:3-keto-L-gulonate-6-phosphate decarboxylase